MLDIKPKTHFKMKRVRGAVRQLTCFEAQCPKQANGWLVPLATPAQDDMINWVRAGNTRRAYTEKRESPGLVSFYFAAGQNCFETQWQRDPIFNIGRFEQDRRAILYPDGDAFVEDSDKHLRKLKEVING